MFKGIRRWWKRKYLKYLLNKYQRYSSISFEELHQKIGDLLLNRKNNTFKFVSTGTGKQEAKHLNTIHYLKLGLIPLTTEMIANELDPERRQELIKACLLREKDPT